MFTGPPMRSLKKGNIAREGRNASLPLKALRFRAAGGFEFRESIALKRFKL